MVTRCSGRESDLEWLLKWLQKEIQVVEKSEMYKSSVKNEEGKKVNKEMSKSSKDKLFTVSALYAAFPSEGSSVFCNRRTTNQKNVIVF